MVCEDESDACKKARKDWETASADKKTAENHIRVEKAQRNQSGAAAGAGAVAIAAGVIGFFLGGPPGFLVAAAVGVAVFGFFGRKAKLRHSNLVFWRKKCEAARQDMENAHKDAKTHCKAATCVPPRPPNGYPPCP